ADSNARIDLNFSKNGNTVSDGGFAAFTVAKNVHGFTAMRAGERAHVFDDAEHINLHLSKHFDGFANVGECNGGRSRNDNGASDRDGLDERELNVAGAGREVDDEVVEFAPLHAAEKLRDDAVQHWAAPDDWLVAGIEQTHRNHLTPCACTGMMC